LVTGFLASRYYTRAIQWPALEDRWVQKFSEKGTRIPKTLDYPNIDVPLKKGKKEATKKAAQKSIIFKQHEEIPDAVPAINPVTPFLVTNAFGLDVAGVEGEAVGEAVDASVVPETGLLIERGGIATQSLVDDVEELIEGKIVSPQKQLLDTRSDKGKAPGVKTIMNRMYDKAQAKRDGMRGLETNSNEDPPKYTYSISNPVVKTCNPVACNPVACNPVACNPQ
jgi:hypothetical protein